MLKQIILGGVVSLANIAIHVTVMTVVVTVARRASRARSQESPWWLPTIMMAAGTILLVTHVASVALWATVYAVVQVASGTDRALYFAFVNYTTLGYGDVLPGRAWELMGPITAMNGIFLFGWTIAVTFEILRLAMGRADKSR